MRHIKEFIENFISSGNYPILHQIERYGTNPIVKIDGKDYLMFASNNYLSLSNDARVISAASKALQENGLGPGGSRFLCGNIEILKNLEKQLSDFIGVEDVITFPTGYMANMTAISALLGEFMNNKPHNVQTALVFSDQNNHATLVDGIKISKANKIIYPHLNYEYLENELYNNKNSHPKLILTESVYSMDGDMVDIDKLVMLSKKYNAMLMVDDAHGVGVLGKKGGGVIEHFNQYDNIDLVMGSLDKAMGGMGGYLGGSRELVKYLRIVSRPYIFSSSIPASVAGGIIESIEICKNEPQRRAELIEKAKYVRKKILSEGFKIMGNSELPVLPVFIGDSDLCKKISEFLFKEKIFIPAIIWPAVHPDKARLRITLMRDHTKENLDYLISKLSEAKKLLTKRYE